MTFKFEGNWESSGAGCSVSIKFEIWLKVSAILALLHFLLS
ncbi:hypothetical protein [Xanthomonas sp. CFBP 8445]|nr:hypothetical protein [Xanthomonas sp. CFBP 8445]UYC11195.1 hypothetical protein NUG21_15680 [Xanthomonas sp. CFBP 8445]